MVQATDELVETVHRGQVFIEVALMVLAELAGGIALRLQHGGDRDIGLLPTLGGSRHADLGHPGSHRHGAVEESSPAGRAGLLTVVVRKGDPLPGDAVDVGSSVAHHATVVVADIPGADIVAPDHQDIRLLPLCEHRAGVHNKSQGERE